MGILGNIQWIGYAIAIGMLIYIGIKYTMASASEKADLKGYMIKFVIESSHFVRSLFSSEEVLTIKFTQIKKMGEDVILIDIS